MESIFRVLFKPFTKDKLYTHHCALISFVHENYSVRLLAHETFYELTEALKSKDDSIAITVRGEINYFIPIQFTHYGYHSLT